MNNGCGVDIVEIRRIKIAIDSCGEKFLTKIFTPSEKEYCESRKIAKYQHYAARFAAKEAVAKVLGTGFSNGIKWPDIEVVCESRGEPAIVLHRTAEELAKDLGVEKIHISLSHCGCHAVAIAVSCGDKIMKKYTVLKNEP